jgi:hypothetical protein
MKVIGVFVLFWLAMSGSARSAVLYVVGDEPLQRVLARAALGRNDDRWKLLSHGSFPRTRESRPSLRQNRGRCRQTALDSGSRCAWPE